MLLVITSLLAQTFLTLTRSPLGFEPSNLAVADLGMPLERDPSLRAGPAERLDRYERVAAAIAAIPGVQRVAASTSPPLFSGGLVSVRTNGDQTQTPNRVSSQDVTNDFFETLAMPIVTGRAFDRRDSSLVAARRHHQRAGGPAAVCLRRSGDRTPAVHRSRNSRAKSSASSATRHRCSSTRSNGRRTRSSTCPRRRASRRS